MPLLRRIEYSNINVLNSCRIMEANKKATFAAPRTNRGKGSDNIPIIKTIESLFMTGRKFYAKELNELAHTNDARKFISDLRRAGVNIQDSWQPNGCKLYWVNLCNNRQLSFWERWEGVRYE